MALLKIGNKHLARLALYAIPSLCIFEGVMMEPEWVVVRELDLVPGEEGHRVVHFTDLHYRGDRAYLKGVIAKINALDPDFVCFTGDIIEDKKHLAEALDLLRLIKTPLYGVPGNHDYWCGAPFADIAAAFRATGGAWLVDEAVRVPGGGVTIVGASSHKTDFVTGGGRGKQILLTHYPAFTDLLPKGVTFDLILAGHSHGGQLRIPFWGAVAVPWGTGRYEKGFYRTAAGPLYVNPGIGTFYLPVRLFCRPEITVIHC
ncbi:MAG: metallophosphoesterase [Candidatus Aureabacteria bacterium]|nr:metallophosphoesterase [Candidatus Auribacterota bacterium]